MNKTTKKMVISILEKEVIDLDKENQLRIVDIILEYITLLNNGNIEKANELVSKNQNQLEKLI